MWVDVVVIGATTAVAALLAIDLQLPGGLVEGTHDLATARTAGFTVLVLASLFTCFAARSNTTSAFVHPFANPWLWGAVASSLALQVAVVHLGFLNLAFGTAPLAFGQWLVCAGLASAVLWVSELRKWLLRSSSRGRTVAPGGPATRRDAP